MCKLKKSYSGVEKLHIESNRIQKESLILKKERKASWNKSLF